MSRRYEMTIEVHSPNEAKEAAIHEAIEGHRTVDDYWDNKGSIVCCGDSNLTGGESEQAFARRVSHAIWRANGAYCSVDVRCVYLEDPPTETYTFDEEDYDKWKKAQSPAPNTKT